MTPLLCIFVAGVMLSSAFGLKPQPNVLTGRREHSGFLWLWLKSDADYKKCVQPFANLQGLVTKVSRNASNPAKSVLAGVGFGQKMCSQLGMDLKFEYASRNGKIGSLPASGGDIFVHAKSNSESKLFELNQLILSQMPEGCLQRSEDLYSFLFRGCRDMTGFIDGTMNPKRLERRMVALDSGTAGSFAVTQRWVHQLDKISSMHRATKESFVGRTMQKSEELPNKLPCSHVAKMTGGTTLVNPPKFKIWRQAQSYGNIQGSAGLFFIAFANSTTNFDFMLDAMVGKDGSGEDDCIFHMSQCVSGNYWYFPGAQQLPRLVYSA